MKFSAKTDAVTTHMNTPRSEARQQPILKSTLRGAAKSKVKEKLSLTTDEVKTDTSVAVWCVLLSNLLPNKQVRVLSG